MGKTLASAVLPFACARAGLIHVPINPLLKSHQAAHILEDSDAALLVTLPDRAASLGEAAWGGTALTLEEHWAGRCRWEGRRGGTEGGREGNARWWEAEYK